VIIAVTKLQLAVNTWSAAHPLHSVVNQETGMNDMTTLDSVNLALVCGGATAQRPPKRTAKPWGMSLSSGSRAFGGSGLGHMPSYSK
jgi:hypothetical protein